MKDRVTKQVLAKLRANPTGEYTQEMVEAEVRTAMGPVLSFLFWWMIRIIAENILKTLLSKE